MSVNFKIFFIITCITAPILGYIYMKIMKRNVKIFLETKVINKGIYKNKPVYGDKVIPIARSFERIGVIFFAFTIIMSVFFGLLLYRDW
jgi:hypothetical protein